MPICYVAPDWGLALRVNGLLESEFGSDHVQHIGPWQHGSIHGTVFAVFSERFPEEWNRKLLDLDEQPWVEGFSGKLQPHPNAERVRAVHEWIDWEIGRRILGEINKQ